MISKQDAKEAAEKGLLEALRCSIAHHEDGRDMSGLELQNAISKEKFSISGRYCGLCQLRWLIGSKPCILKSSCSGYSTTSNDCIREFQEINIAWDNFKADPSNANHTAFIEAEKKMIARLELELEKVEAEEKKKEKNRHCWDCNYSHIDIFDCPCKFCITKSKFEPKEQKAGPELRHGDWWLKSGRNIRIYMKEYNGEKRDCVALPNCIITNIGSEYKGQKIEGNIIDMLNDLKARNGK